MITPYYKSEDRAFTILNGDTFELLPQFNFKFDMIFADPPYFLSSGGISVQSGKIVCVDKGDWDKSMSQDEINAFNLKWLSLCREKLKDNGTIWISGTYHNIFSVANCLTQLGYKILNVITWAKTNPPPNISCRYFTYSTEFIIWARKSEKVAHYYNYDLMKHINGDKQMTDVWRLPAIAPWEKSCGKHPTQKPLCVLSRIIMASTKPGAWILDPFAGSSTTGIAANLLGRRFLGIEREKEYAAMSKARSMEIDIVDNYVGFRKKIPDIMKAEDTQTDCFACCEPLPIEYLSFLDGEMKEKTVEPIRWVFNWLFMKTIVKKEQNIGLLPVIYENSDVLILGAKLLKNENLETAKANRFWKVISNKYNGGHKFYDKIDKISCLKRNRLALWDVFQPDGKKNDIDTFILQHSQIKELIVFGKGVFRYYKPSEAIKKKVRIMDGL
jgi:site-specific DNA-methyltransferase (adenine-specific)